MNRLTRKQAREVDRQAVEAGLPSIVLMENAAIHTAAAVFEALASTVAPDEARVVVLCGGGNNGGDGYAIARHLHNRGANVTIYAVVPAERLKGDAEINHRVCRHLGLDIRPLSTAAQLDSEASTWSAAHVLIDAMLGTGFRGEVRKHMAEVIRCADQLDGPMTVAVDVPSGLDCETGEPANAAIRADLTVTFVAPKTGFDQPAARERLGRVIVADIGVPPPFVSRAVSRTT